MLMIHASTSIRSVWTDGESKPFLQASPGSILQANYMSNTVAFPNSLESQVQKSCTFSSFKYHSSRLRSHHLWGACKEGITKNWLRCLHINASMDEDYRSSRNIAISLFKRYRNVIDRGGGDSLKEFISAGVNAYALGCTDEGLRKELMNIKDSGIEIEGLQTYGGGTSVKFKILAEEVHECILWLSIVFITILCTPQPTIVRWSSTSPVSSEVMHQWRGFCALIANAYYTRGMAWLPVKTLQLEQMAVLGSSEEPSVVASRMRLVFSTLEVVSPQWPRV
ncbi:uncharacterized protein [Elaeis guineensis]|uniref:Uncharacterized protein LOC105042200 n=1 Tax=Elaeis guineensis var. tenera TaxID=51953 RepID=A0A6I9QYW1_ELAGV|nr:uncharacterized protein LOC105042200 [Elaeis guineensis]XP_010917622.1 uncharacterized protein LOC105042200 [Elaeis guineensis]